MRDYESQKVDNSHVVLRACFINWFWVGHGFSRADQDL